MEILLVVIAVALICLGLSITAGLDRIRRAIIAASDLNLEAQKRTRDVLEDEISSRNSEKIEASFAERRERFL